MEGITVYIVFLEGVATFLSPCILPLIPVYVSYITGYSLEELESGMEVRKQTVVLNALFFVLGFGIIFILLGATASALGRFMFSNRALLRKISGILIAVMGMYISGIIKIPFLKADRRIRVKAIRNRAVTSFAMGTAFGLGWTPCVGPVLGSVLILAGTSGTVFAGIGFLAVYSLGLGLPFMASALLISCFTRGLNRIAPYLNIIKAVSGILLIVMGIMIYTGYTSTGGIY